MRTLAVSGGGGNGVRKAVVDGTEVTIIGEDRGIKSVKDFVDFVTSDGMPDIDGIACSLTGDLI